MTTVCKVMRYETCIKKSCNSKILQKSPQPWLWPKLVNFCFVQLNLSSCALFKACFLDIPLAFPRLIGSPFPLNSSSADPHLTLVHPAQNHPNSHGLCPGWQLFSWFHHGFTVHPQIKYDDSISYQLVSIVDHVQSHPFTTWPRSQLQASAPTRRLLAHDGAIMGSVLAYKIFNTGITAFVVELQFLLVKNHFRC